MRIRPVRQFFPVLLAAGGMALASPTAAQQSEPPAKRGTLTIGQQIAVDNGDVIGITPIDLEFRSGSRIQTLQFSMSLPLEMNDPDHDGLVSLGDAQARLLYRRGVRNAAIETELSYREVDLDRDILFDRETNSLVTLDRGRAAYSNARIGYVFGQQARFGGELGLGYSRQDYTDTTDPSLHDSETRQGNITLYLEPTSLIRARILASESRIDSDGGTDSRISRAGIGASMQVGKLTNLDIELARSDIHREENDGSEERAKGPSWRLNLTHARPLGDWSLALSSDPGTHGRRESFTLGRVLKLPDYSLSASLGLSHFQDNYDPIFQIGYDRNLDRLSKFQASLRRAAVTDDDGDEAINTDILASYSRQLGPLSSLSASIRYRESNVQTGTREDARTMALSVSYSRSISSRLSLVAGANVIRGRDSNGSREDDDRIWLGLSRSFDWLP